MDIERSIFVFINLGGQDVPCGLLKCQIEDDKLVSSSFRYGLKYLERDDLVAIDIKKLPLQNIEFSTEDEFDLFTGIKDAMPDAWGRAVMEKRADRPMREDEILLATSPNRVGALSFGLDLTGPKRVTPWQSDQEDRSVVNLDEIYESYLQLSETDTNELEDAMRQYVLPGSSMGGARPKATCSWHGDDLWLAKFSRDNDSFDYIRSEYAVMLLARDCGIDVPEVDLAHILDRSIFLIKRFDRDGDVKYPFNSFLAVLGETELSFMHASYMDMAEALKKYSKNHIKDQKQLFLRMVFNGLCGNNDDHLRNHAMIYNTKIKSYELSPAYDIVPNPKFVGSGKLAIGCGYGDDGRTTTRVFNRESVLKAHRHFSLSLDEATQIFDQMHLKVQTDWRKQFKAVGFTDNELSVFTGAFTVSQPCI